MQNKLRFIFPVLIILLCMPMTINAGMFQHYGAELSFGGFDDIAPGASDPNYKFNWLSATYFGQHDFDEDGDWNAKLEGTIGYLRWSADKRGEGNYDTFSIGAQLVFYRHLFGSLSLGLGGGFCTLSDTKDLPDLGDSGLYGTITGRLKMEVAKNYGVEFAADHISDTLQNGNEGDAGKNVLALKIYYTFD